MALAGREMLTAALALIFFLISLMSQPVTLKGLIGDAALLLGSLVSTLGCFCSSGTKYGWKGIRVELSKLTCRYPRVMQPMVSC